MTVIVPKIVVELRPFYVLAKDMAAVYHSVNGSEIA